MRQRIADADAPFSQRETPATPSRGAVMGTIIGMCMPTAANRGRPIMRFTSLYEPVERVGDHAHDIVAVWQFADLDRLVEAVKSCLHPPRAHQEKS